MTTGKVPPSYIQQSKQLPDYYAESYYGKSVRYGDKCFAPYTQQSSDSTDGYVVAQQGISIRSGNNDLPTYVTRTAEITYAVTE